MYGFCNVWGFLCVVFVMCGFCYVWDLLCVGFVMCGFSDNCVGVLVICVLEFAVFCIVCTVSLYCFVYVDLFLFVLSGLV
jgi:hypothetical protein